MRSWTAKEFDSWFLGEGGGVMDDVEEEYAFWILEGCGN